MQGFIEFLIRRRYPLAIITILLGSVVSWGIVFTQIDSTDRTILPDDDPYLLEVMEVDEKFPPSTSALFAFIGPQGDVFNRDTLQAMEDLHDRYLEVESAVSVGSMVNHRLTAVDAAEQNRDYLLPELDLLDEVDLADIREVALNDEGLTKSLLSPGGDMALAVIKYRINDDVADQRLSIARSVVKLRDGLREAHPEVTIYVLGRDLFELDSHNAAIKDRSNLFPLVVGATTLLLWLCLNSLAFSLCIFVISSCTLMLTVGSVGWSGLAFNQISNMGPLVVLTIAMADAIHLVSVYIQGLHNGLDKEEALRQSIRLNFQPISLATLTTAMGFLSLNYCSSAGIYGFGNVVALGVAWAYIVTLTILPALITLIPVRKIPRPLGIRRFMAGISQLVAQRGNLLFWGSIVIIVGTTALLPMNKIDFNRYSFIDKKSDFHKVITALSEKIGNDQSLVFTVDSGKYYGITEPEFLRQVETFSLWLEDQPEASFVNSYIGLLKNLNESEHDNDEAWHVIPDDNLQVIDYLVTYQLVQEIEPHMEHIFEYESVRLIVGTSRLSNLELLAFNKKIEVWLAENLNPEYRVLHGDRSILFARLNHTISVQLMQGFTLSFVLITLTILVGLRSVRYGLLSMIPNLFPATIVFGVWGLFVGELSPYVLMLFSISIGLVVDDSVHVLSKYISAKREGMSPEDAVQYSLDRAGSAITITTAALAMGTAILVFSNTYYYQNVALMLTPIIVIALLLDLLFLPPLLVKFDNWMDKRGVG
jgi:predicted RND superfamily exporter protein